MKYHHRSLSEQDFLFLLIHTTRATLCHVFFTSSVKKVVGTCLSCSNRRLVLCSISPGVQDSLYIINLTYTTFLFHPLTLRLRHASPLPSLTSPVGCLPTTSNLASTILRSFFPPGKSCPLQGLSITADKTTFTPEQTAKSLCLPQDNQLSAAPRVQACRFALNNLHPIQLFLISVLAKLLYFFYSYVLFWLLKNKTHPEPPITPPKYWKPPHLQFHKFLHFTAFINSLSCLPLTFCM